MTRIGLYFIFYKTNSKTTKGNERKRKRSKGKRVRGFFGLRKDKRIPETVAGKQSSPGLAKGEWFQNQTPVNFLIGFPGSLVGLGLEVCPVGGTAMQELHVFLQKFPARHRRSRERSHDRFRSSDWQSVG